MNEKKFRTLEHVHSSDGLSKSDIAERIETSRQNVGQNIIPDLKEKNLVEINDDIWPHEVQVTDDGKDFLIENDVTTTRHESVYNESKSDPRFIHRIVLEFPIQNASMLKDDWKERVFSEVNQDVNYVEEFERYEFSVDKYRFHVHGDTVQVKLREEVRGQHYREVVDKAISKCIEGAEFFQDIDEIPVVLDDSPSSYRVVEQHIGSSGDNLVHAFVKYVDEKTDSNVSNWKAYEREDDNNELLIWADKSSGELHEESGNGGNPSGSRERAVDVQKKTEEWTELMVSRPDDTTELLRDGNSRINELEGLGEEVKSEQERQGEVLEKLQEVVSELQSTRKDEKDTRDALIELVRSNQMTIQSNQEIIERQEEMIEKQAEVIGSLQDEIEDLRNSKSLEARVRERFDSHPDFSSVHEHANDGNRSLYVWDRSGDDVEYRKVLDEEARMIA